MSERMWEEFLADVESQMEAEIREETLVEAAELRAAEEATTALDERLRAHGQAPLTLFVDGDPIEVVVRECAAEWMYCLRAQCSCLIRIGAIEALKGLTWAVRSGRSVADSLSFASALRRFALGEQVACHVRSGEFRGRLVRVGKDYVDVDTASGCVCIAQNSIMRVDLSVRQADV